MGLLQVTQKALYTRETTKYIRKLPSRTIPWMRVCGGKEESALEGIGLISGTMIELLG